LAIPAGAYPGLAAALPSVGSWSVILARADLDEALAFRFAKALHAAERGLAARLAQAGETRAGNTLAAAPRPEMIHPGVLRYLREAG
ncbi:TAXI family TRAP transporter solute-binding subunit, partial [Klebsiella pneumoniae]|uniref:TAXI family TRAP transporter solute-binding subunit n=1 Tax=Klebsiella pneumoniae TaxID=573 RepID=UPI00195337AA